MLSSFPASPLWTSKPIIFPFASNRVLPNPATKYCLTTLVSAFSGASILHRIKSLPIPPMMPDKASLHYICSESHGSAFLGNVSYCQRKWNHVRETTMDMSKTTINVYSDKELSLSVPNKPVPIWIQHRFRLVQLCYSNL